MQATLYAVKLEGIWSWRATLDYALDRVYWQEKLGNGAQNVRLKEPISWGQAVRLSKWLTWSASEPRRSGLQPAGRNYPNEWREIINAADSGGLKAQALMKWLNNPNAWVEDTIEGNGKQLFLDAQTVLHHAEVRQIAELLRGRFLFGDELLSLCSAHEIKLSVGWTSLVQAGSLRGLVEMGCGIEAVPEGNRRRRSKTAVRWCCSRCGSGPEAMRLAECLYCGGPCPYCQNCLGMGRSRCCTPILTGCGDEGEQAGVAFVQPQSAQHPHLMYASLLERFGLSPAQREAAGQALAFLERTENGQQGGELLSPPSEKRRDQRPPVREFLLWAVTGAGKTEMMYPLIAHEVAAGRKVLVATPRRDVVLELLPRMQRAFPECTLVALYGGSEQRWETADITLATTHQLLRFRSRFDLAVIDELDAFPFHNNPVLQYAARMAVRPGGRTLYLSATPPTAMQREVKLGRLPCARVPVRFHRRPLPVPWLLRIAPLAKWLEAERLPAKLKRLLDRSLERGAQLFLFVPQIKWVIPLVNLLRRVYPGEVIEGTSSQDEGRTDKVAGLRGQTIRLLVTTTILERGVTIPKSDVFVLDAGAELFDEAALVQMAGRAGRSMDDPAGYVVFAAAQLTRSQTGAVSQIRRMNRLALRKGFLLAEKKKNGCRLRRGGEG